MENKYPPKYVRPKELEKINIVSYGGGQNSTAMIIEMKNRNIKIDEVIISDTGDEMPETYEFIKEFEVWCKKNNIPFVIIKSEHGRLRDYYFKRNLIPYRAFRHCTGRFKIRPMNKYIKEKYGIKEPINMFMGIASDESHRAGKIFGRKQFTYKFPLIDWEVDRKGCVDIIKKEGLSIPVKSGCYFCPFQPKKSWRDLLKKHPELFQDSIDFEKNCRAYPVGTLMGEKKLEEFRKEVKEQKVLFNEPDNPSYNACFYCHA